MSQELAAIEDRKLLESGLHPSRHDRDVPLWKDGKNILFEDGGPQKIGGWTSIASITPNGHVRGAGALQTGSGTKRMYFGDKNELYKLESGSITSEGSGYTGGAKDQWDFESFGDWMLATNGVDAPQIDKGSGFSSLSGTNFTTAEVFVKRGPHMLAANSSNGQTFLEWSNADDPETWSSSQTNSAGQLNIREMNGPIVAAVAVSSEVALIGRDQVMQVRFVGDPFIFGYEPRLTGIGAVSKNAVVESNGLLFGMGQYGFWQSDLRSFKYIGDREIWDYVVENADFGNISKVCCDFDSDKKVISWFLPGKNSGEIDWGVAFNIDRQVWTIYDWGRTATVPNLAIFEKPHRVTAAGTVMKHNTGVDANGNKLVARVQSKPMDFEKPRTWKYVDVVQPELRRLNNKARVRIGWQEFLTGAISWEPWQDIGDLFPDVFFRLAGRFISFELEVDDLGEDFALSGLRFYGMPAGQGF